MAQQAQETFIFSGDTPVPTTTTIYTVIAKANTFSGPGVSAETVDVSDLADTAKVYASAGISDAGALTIDLNFEPDLAIHDTLVGRCQSGNPAAYMIVFSNIADNTDVVDSVAGSILTLNGHSFRIGQPVRLTTTNTLPDPLVVGTTYWVIRTDDNDIKLAITNANAVANTEITLLDGGTGTHTVTFGTRYNFAAVLDGAEPSGSGADKLAASLSLKLSQAITITT